MVKGFDFSFNQKNVDYHRVKEAGYDFGIIRAGFGNDALQEDKQFKTHMDGCLNAGIGVGNYWMSYSRTVEEARQEARALLKVIKPYHGKITYPLYFDWEGDSWRYCVENGVQPTKELISAMAEAFCLELEANGYWAGIYTNLNYYKNYFDPKVIGRFTVWLADYVGEPDFQCDMQQSSSEGHIDGVNGNVDINICTRDFPREITGQCMQGLVPTNEGTEEVTEDNSPIIISYQGWDDVKNQWLPNVTGADENDHVNGYAGKAGDDICAVFASLSRGNITLRTHTLPPKTIDAGHQWLPEVTNREDFAGIYNVPIDGIMGKIDVPGKTLHIKAHLRDENRWLGDITGYDPKDKLYGYSGVIGHPIDKIMMWID